MKGQLNIYRDNFLEKEELDRLMTFIKDNPALFLFISSTQSFGVIQQGASISVDPAFKVEVGTNSNTLKITTDSYAIDMNGNMIYQRAFDNLPLPTVDSTWYWMKISHRYDNYEQGFVDIAADGTLSGVGTLFTDVLRGASSGFPTKLKFYTQEDDGTLVSANNSGIYEVVSVAGNNTAVIAGNLSAETHLRFIVLGAFSIKTSIAEISSTGLYSYDSCQIDFVAETETDTAPTTGYTEGEDFYIARVNSDGATARVQDKRVDYYFRINFGDIVVSNKANIDATNMTAPADIAAWIAALAVYTSSQVDALLAGYMLKSQNLNDLSNKNTARTNLDVYSKSYIDQLGTFLTKAVIEIGDWNMDANAFVSVSLGTIDPTMVRSIKALIRNDANNVYYDLTPDPANPNAVSDLTNLIVLYRIAGGSFDNNAFDSVSYNRGWVVVEYIPS